MRTRIVIALLAFVVAGAGVWGGVVPPPQEAKAQTTPPNILIFLTDDQRATDTLEWMPRIRQWFGLGGTQYSRFFATTPLCCPDRSVILSGRYAHNTNVRRNADTGLFDHSRTMERLLDARGYETTYVGKFLNGWNLGTRPPYFDHRSLFAGGYFNTFWNIDGVGTSVSGYSTAFVGDRAVAYLNQFEANDAQPWMLFVGTTAPHYPWQPSQYWANYPVGTWAGNPATNEADRSDKPPWVRQRSFTLAQAQNVRTPQLRTLRSVDDQVAKVMTAAQSLGELGSTLAIFTSDNGYVWAEHKLGGDFGSAGQKRYPYTQSIQVPFLLRWPGHVTAGAIDGRLAGTVDIAPTVLEAAGVVPDYPIDGRSLLTSARSRILLEYWLDPGDIGIPSWRSLRTATYQYVEWYNESTDAITFREYYDLAADPWQLTNLLADGNPANDPNVSGISQQLRLDAACIGASCP